MVIEVVGSPLGVLPELVVTMIGVVLCPTPVEELRTAMVEVVGLALVVVVLLVGSDVVRLPRAAAWAMPTKVRILNTCILVSA